nr:MULTISPECIES: ATP-binding cassette domain-containing protein [unclassified Rhodococcus (in: high G+C Gram-positive bacteria)]
MYQRRLSNCFLCLSIASEVLDSAACMAVQCSRPPVRCGSGHNLKGRTEDAEESCSSPRNRLDARVDRLPFGSLPHGTQKRIELARALAMEPRLIMIDEPVAGMSHDETAEMTETIVQVNRDLDVAILLVEHDMKIVMGISNRVCVLNFGHRIALGRPAEVIRDEAVVAAYLGAA